VIDTIKFLETILHTNGHYLWLTDKLTNSLTHSLTLVLRFPWLLFNVQLCFWKYVAYLVPATEHGYLSPTDDVRHYVIPQKLLDSIFKKLPVCSPAPIADSFHVATMARKHSVLNLREINRNNTHTALASVITYYGWVSLIFLVSSL
jgi:hypothetical protein